MAPIKVVGTQSSPYVVRPMVHGDPCTASAVTVRIRGTLARRPEQADGRLARHEELQKPRGKAPRKSAADERAGAQAQHEHRHDQRHRLDVDAEGVEQQPLPRNLVDERGEARRGRTSGTEPSSRAAGRRVVSPASARRSSRSAGLRSVATKERHCTGGKIRHHEPGAAALTNLATKYPSVPCTCGTIRKLVAAPDSAVTLGRIEGRRRKSGARRQQRRHHRLGLLAQHAAHDVDERPARPHAVGARGGDRKLGRGLSRDVFLLQSQSDLGPVPQGSHARARCVDEHPVVFRGDVARSDRPVDRVLSRTASPSLASSCVSQSSFAPLVSHASTAPVSPTARASIPVLFPRPAHASRTCSPGRAPSASAAIWEPSSWIVHAPSAHPGRLGSPGAARRDRRGDRRPGLEGRVRERPREGEPSTRRAPRRARRAASRAAPRPPCRASRAWRRSRGARSSAARNHAGVDATSAAARRASSVVGRSRRQLAQHGVREARHLRAALAAHRLDRLAHGREGRHPHEEELVRRQEQVRLERARRACPPRASQTGRSRRGSHGRTRRLPYTSSVASARSRALSCTARASSASSTAEAKASSFTTRAMTRAALTRPTRLAVTSGARGPGSR